jgi:Phage major capsid protein E
MPQPTRSDVHVNRPLTNMSVAYIQKATDFVADKVFGIVPVMKQSDRYFVYTKQYWFQTKAELRAPASETAGGGFHVDNTPSYFCDVWGFHMDVDDQTRANADQPLDLDRDATLYVTQNLLLRRETQFVKNYFKANTWTGNGASNDFTPSTKWDNSSSNPMQDVDTLKSTIKSNTGYLPNCLVVAPDVFFALRNNAAVLDRIKYTQRGLVSEDLLATLFGVDKFLVAWAVNATSNENQASQSFSYLVSNQFLLVYANPAPSILQPSGGYIFSWQGLFGAGAQGNRISSFRMEHLKADRIEGEMSFAMKLVASDVGVFATSVLGTP